LANIFNGASTAFQKGKADDNPGGGLRPEVMMTNYIIPAMLPQSPTAYQTT